MSPRDEVPFEGPQGPDAVNPAHSFDAYRFARERFFRAPARRFGGPSSREEGAPARRHDRRASDRMSPVRLVAHGPGTRGPAPCQARARRGT